jgi:hypothetical protein
MKFSMKPVAAAVVAMASSAAFAAAPGPIVTLNATDTPGTTNGTGSLMLYVWDTAVGDSAVFDLNLNISQISIPDMTIPGTQITFTGANLAAAGLPAPSSSTHYMIAAGDNSSIPWASLGRNLYITGTGYGSLGQGNNAVSLSSMNGTIQQMASYNAGIINTAVDDGGCEGANPCLMTDNFKFWGNDGVFTSPFLQSLGFGSNNGQQAWGVVGAALDFWAFTTSGTSDSNVNLAINRYTGGQWLLGATGDLTYTVAASAVPLPAAVWLLGSGLLGLGTVARRRRNAVAAA